jgi:pyridoxamine 5'-phosphate oxidase
VPDSLTPRPSLAAERMDYLGDHLLESQSPAEPFALFDAWLNDAFAAKERGQLAEPTAMVVATSVDNRPSARTVLLKEADDSGFVFFTNYHSDKGRALAGNPYAALHFGWYPLHRQVRVEGSVAAVGRAWASAQSSVVASVEELAESYRAAEERFVGVEVPCPEHWGGFRVTPNLVEFWQGQPSRMHDRLLYRRSVGGSWTLTRLAP